MLLSQFQPIMQNDIKLASEAVPCIGPYGTHNGEGACEGHKYWKSTVKISS